MKRHLLLFAVLMLLAPLSAATYYASPDGTGNGSYNSPCSFGNGLLKLLAKYREMLSFLEKNGIDPEKVFGDAKAKGLS